ncbi:hypothetical protein V491_05149, partial [Pseudogymnoascus sp. VKM F-3775]
TAGGSFWRLPTSAPRLYEDLKESTLVVFKGDLNYRKLVADAAWAPTTPFADALGPMGKGSGVDLLSLRTCKADVVVGLPEGKDEELQAEQGDGEGRQWAWSGKWAVKHLTELGGETDRPGLPPSPTPSFHMPISDATSGSVIYSTSAPRPQAINPPPQPSTVGGPSALGDPSPGEIAMDEAWYGGDCDGQLVLPWAAVSAS